MSHREGVVVSTLSMKSPMVIAGLPTKLRLDTRCNSEESSIYKLYQALGLVTTVDYGVKRSINLPSITTIVLTRPRLQG